MSAFIFADLVGLVDGLSARKVVLAERISRLATAPSSGRPSPGCERVRALTS
jgi:hypothetical protein